MQETLPTAEVRPRKSSLWLGWLPLLALLIAAYMVFSSVSEKGLLITVHAQEGHGIRDGASVRYRGIQVGTVERVRLEPSMGGVEIVVRLDQDARDLARKGSQFWIVYPRVGLDGIQGIETVIGARYLAVAPGTDPEGSEIERDFDALDEPPVEDTLAQGGLEIVLEAPSKFGLVAGAPITFRGFWIGRVVSVELASDATVVEVSCRIAREYRSLVRDNSVFWEESGIEMDLSLTGGVTLDVGTLRSILMGAVAMATPTRPGDLAQEGDRFALVAGPEKDWHNWRPALPIGKGPMPAGLAPPKPIRAELAWRSGRIVRQRSSKLAWLLSTERGLLGPKQFFELPESAREEGLEFKVGEQVSANLPPVEFLGGVALTSFDPAGTTEVWPADRIRSLGDPEDCMVYAGDDLAPQSIAAYRMKRSSRGLEVNQDLRFSREWNGAPVIAREDGMLVGLLVLVDGHAHVAGVSID